MSSQVVESQPRSLKQKILSSIIPHYEAEPTSEEYETAKTLLSFGKLVSQSESSNIKYKSAEVESILQPRSFPLVNTIEAHAFKATRAASVGSIIPPDQWQVCPFGLFHYLWTNSDDLCLTPKFPVKSKPSRKSLQIPIPLVTKKVDSNQPKISVKKDANRIRRPQNAFMIFSRRYRPQALLKLKESNPKGNNRHVSNILAEWYNRMPSKDREQYGELARKIKEVHNMRYPDFEWNKGKKVLKDRLLPASPEALEQADSVISNMTKRLPDFDPNNLETPKTEFELDELVNSFRSKKESVNKADSRKSIDAQRQLMFKFLNSNGWYPTDAEVDEHFKENQGMFESKKNFMKRMQEVRQQFHKRNKSAN